MKLKSRYICVVGLALSFLLGLSKGYAQEFQANEISDTYLVIPTDQEQLQQDRLDSALEMKEATPRKSTETVGEENVAHTNAPSRESKGFSYGHNRHLLKGSWKTSNLQDLGSLSPLPANRMGQKLSRGAIGYEFNVKSGESRQVFIGAQMLKEIVTVNGKPTSKVELSPDGTYLYLRMNFGSRGR